MKTTARPLTAQHIARRASPWSAAALVGSACVIALAFGLAGAVFGWVTQLFLLTILVPLFIIALDYRLVLILAALVLPLSNARFLPKIGPVAVDNVVLAGALVAFVLAWSTRKLSRQRLELPIPKQLFWFYIVPLTMATVIGTFHLSEIPQAYLIERSVPRYGLREYWISQYLKQMLLIFLGCAIGATVIEKGRGSQFFVAIVISGSVVGALILALMLGSGVSLQHAVTLRERLLEPMGFHPNSLGAILAFPFGVALFMREGVRSGLGHILLLSAAAIMVGAVAVSFSRGAFLALTVVGLVYVFTYRRLGVLLGAAMIVLLGAAFAPTIVLERLLTGIESGGVDAALQASSGDALTAGRTLVWKVLAPEILNNPFLGNGQNSMQWSSAIKSGMFTFVSAHSLYLNLLLDSGAFGSCAVLAFYLYVLRTFRGLGREPLLDAPSREAFMGAFAGLIAFLIYGFTNGDWIPNPTQPFMWMLIGLAIGWKKRIAPQLDAESTTRSAHIRRTPGGVARAERPVMASPESRR